MLELTVESYRYPGYARSVLHDLELRLDDGEIVGLVGPNEAGKSTLCLVAAGLAPASIGGVLKGSLRLDGQAAAGLKTHELAERVVVGFQNANTQRSGLAATVFEEIAVGPMNLGLPVVETVARTREAIARLLDEPTAQLDPEGTRLVGEALRALADGGTSLLIAEHKTDLLDGLCSRTLVINDGTIVRDGPTAQVFGDPELEAIGVEPPAAVHLRRAVVAAGLDPLLLAAGSS
jgi:energy-coupling factor transport system ATP-binding protein